MDRRMNQYRRDRRWFALTVYFIATVFVIITIAQWLPMLMIPAYKKFILDTVWFHILFLAICLVCVTLFVFFEGMRFTFPINWLMAVIIVECTTYGLSRAIIATELNHFGLCLLTGFPMMIFIALGINMQHDLTLDIVVLFVLAVVFFTGSAFFLFMYIMADQNNAVYVYAIFLILTVLMFAMYHAQTINGGRYAEMRLIDYLLAALIIYNDFIIIYMLSLCIGFSFHRGNKFPTISNVTTEMISGIIETTTLGAGAGPAKKPPAAAPEAPAAPGYDY